ncbi:hypothetical protein [Aeromonas veronii]|uniref:hypothetical protein n=1 Tax=Aeromonas veronii TaxID=654 RepID=UPI003B9E4794
MKPVLVVNLIATYPTGRHPESCARSSWRVAAARVPDIDTVVGVYQGMVVAVIRGCSLVPSTPEVVGDDWDEACRGRYYALGGEAFTDRDVSVWSLTRCPQLLVPLSSVQGIRYLSREEFDRIPMGNVQLK